MPYVSEARLNVRSYELDSYGHVNNAVYMQWLEHGRSRLLQDKGFCYHGITDAWNVRFLTVSTKIDYKLSLDLGEDVLVTTQVDRVGRTSVTFDQKVLVHRDGQHLEAATASVVIVFTDTAMEMAVEVPQPFKDLYL